MNRQQLAATTKRAAQELGFEACGITDLRASGTAAALEDWLAKGYHGQMGYMTRQAPLRKEPNLVWEAAASAVVVLHNYYQHQPRLKDSYRVARYAQGEDYHKVIKEKLDRLGAAIVAAAGAGRWRSYVDAGPLPERELAQRAGLGWMAKNTMLIHPGLGSFTFIGVVLTDLELATDRPFEADRCGTCTRCLDACPTGAFPAPRVLDSTRCISYLTIEARDDFPPDLARLAGDNLFGCDICQDVCPWNVKFARPASERRYVLGCQDEWPALDGIVRMDQRAFDDRFGNTALRRARLAGLRRNALVVLHNARSAGAALAGLPEVTGGAS